MWKKENRYIFVTMHKPQVQVGKAPPHNLICNSLITKNLNISLSISQSFQIPLLWILGLVLYLIFDWVVQRKWESLELIGTGENFLHRTPMAQALRSRIDKWDLLKLEIFCKSNWLGCSVFLVVNFLSSFIFWILDPKHIQGDKWKQLQ